MARTRRRLDAELVRRKLSANTAAAQSAISSGRVLVGGALAAKPSRLVSEAEPVVVRSDEPTYASRGGHKLAAALDYFSTDPTGRVAIDVGASTGGFTDCLLQRGAKKVFAIDVGRGLLLTRLANDERVVVMDNCNVRYLTRDSLTRDTPNADSSSADSNSDSGTGASSSVASIANSGIANSGATLITADLSFISLQTVMPNLAALADTGPAGTGPAAVDLLLLVKPQFELSRADVAPTAGVVTDPALWRKAVKAVAQSATEHGLEPQAEFQSPLQGAAGNTEFFLHAKRFGGQLPKAPPQATQQTTRQTTPQTTPQTQQAQSVQQNESGH